MRSEIRKKVRSVRVAYKTAMTMGRSIHIKNKLGIDYANKMLVEANNAALQVNQRLPYALIVRQIN